jgi:hypothetical protein
MPAKKTKDMEELDEVIDEQEDEVIDEVEEPTPVAGMIVVLDRETMEEVTIDPAHEKNWKKKYLHRNGNEFDHQY